MISGEVGKKVSASANSKARVSIGVGETSDDVSGICMGMVEQVHTRRTSVDGDLVRVAAEGRDVLAHPLHSEALVLQS